MDTTATLPATGAPHTPMRVDAALLARAQRGDTEAIAALFQPFLPPDEDVRFACYGGVKGLPVVGAHCFAGLTDRRLATLRIGAFGRPVFDGALLSPGGSGVVHRPPALMHGAWHAFAAAVALLVFAGAFFAAVMAVRARGGGGLALAASLIAVGTALALAAYWLVTHVYDRVQRSGLVWTTSDGAELHAWMDRPRLAQADDLLRRCRERYDPLATVQPTRLDAAPVAARSLGTWIVAACVVAAIAAGVAYRWAGRTAVPIVGPVIRPAQPAVVPASPVEATPAQRAAALADAINAELQRIGYGDVSVRVAPDGTATVQGRSASDEERDALLQMIAQVDGVRGVHDALEVPKPQAPPAVPAPAVVAKAPVPTNPAPRVIAVPPQAPAQQVPPPHATPPEPPVEIAAAPPPPDAAQVTRDVQRALARLALPQIGVQVDESLQVTLRGTLNDAARKSQAIAAARAATPSGKVRDLIFVVQE